MHDQSQFLPAVSRDGGRTLSASAIWRGAAVGAGGALVMTTLIGIAAVVGMNLQGLSPEAMLHALQHGIAFRGFVAAAEWLTAIAAGYTSARIAARRQTAHSFWAAAATIALKYVTWTFLGCPWPTLLAAFDLALVVPCAMLGGYLASPSSSRPSEAARPSPTRLNH